MWYTFENTFTLSENQFADVIPDESQSNQRLSYDIHARPHLHEYKKVENKDNLLLAEQRQRVSIQSIDLKHAVKQTC